MPLPNEDAASSRAVPAPRCNVGAPPTALPQPKPDRGGSFTFGIYPGGVGGVSELLPDAPADDPAAIENALDALQQGRRSFLVRGYVGHTMEPAPYPDDLMDIRQYAGQGRKLNVVLAYGLGYGGIDNWLAYVRAFMRTYGRELDSVAITLEANLDFFPGAPGTIPGVREALVKGVIAAKREAIRSGRPSIKIGFDVVAGPTADVPFWQSLRDLGGQRFVRSVDYVGAFVYPDVFGTVTPDGTPTDMRHYIVNTMDQLRNCSMRTAGLGNDVELRIAETGWPTGAGRDEARQAEVVRISTATVAAYSGNFNVDTYLWFDLRDYVTDGIQAHEFGLLRDDYSPKPAFFAFRNAIRMYGRD